VRNPRSSLLFWGVFFITFLPWLLDRSVWFAVSVFKPCIEHVYGDFAVYGGYFVGNNETKKLIGSFTQPIQPFPNLALYWCYLVVCGFWLVPLGFF